MVLSRDVALVKCQRHHNWSHDEYLLIGISALPQDLVLLGFWFAKIVSNFEWDGAHYCAERCNLTLRRGDPDSNKCNDFLRIDMLLGVSLIH
jgi:hypothetical protein